MTVYPPPPARFGITITENDYLCLGMDECINDIIVNFYLTFFKNEKMKKQDQEKTHIFNSHFFQKLLKVKLNDADIAAKITLAAKRHKSIERWTKDVNIFEKDFIIIPINDKTK